jgi:exosortase A
MSEAVADAPMTRMLSGLRDALAGLAIGLAVLGLLFHTEIAAAVRTWIDSTAYNHCFLVIPIALFLIWDRRGSLRGLTAEPMPLTALLVLPLGVIWLASERLGIMEGRQLAALSMAEVLFFAMLGPRLWRAVSGPLLYLYFLVPFGEFLTPKLQDVTTWFTRHGLDILGIPAFIDGYVIEIPEGTFYVAEACAGLRFLIASIAFGVLYSLLMYRSPMRRAIFIIASIIMPVVANGFRALGIVWLGHILGSAEAAATDHILYGWIFFSIVILLLIVAGLPFRQDEQSEAAPMPMTHDPRAARQGLIAGLAVAALAAFCPMIVLGLNQASAAPDVALRPLDLSPSCVNQGAPNLVASGTPGRTIVQRVDCGGTPMTIQIEVFAARSTAGPINAERRHLTRIGGAEDWSEAPMIARNGEPLRPWRLVRGSDPSYLAAAGLWINGEPMPPGIAMRLGMARSSVFGGASAPVLVVITPTADWKHIEEKQKTALEKQIAAMLEARGGIGDQVRAIAGNAH